MVRTNFVKPNMNNLKGRKGRTVIMEIRNMQARPLTDIKDDADACMKRILASRKNGKLIKAWDPDFTKLTTKEKETLEISEREMANGDYITEEDFWK